MAKGWLFRILLDVSRSPSSARQICGHRLPLSWSRATTILEWYLGRPWVPPGLIGLTLVFQMLDKYLATGLSKGLEVIHWLLLDVP